MSPASNTLTCNLHFSITDGIGKLESCLAALKAMNVSLTRIESRPSKTSDWDYDFFIEFQAENQSQVVEVVERLKKHSTQVRVIGSGTAGQGGE
ncbi:hypothetical protein NQZ79_g8916 [Umbelopsis isabellina]|nr:hypothetical protein NQZ79_g8916 [Umbelopsis isabellina]